MTGAGLAPENLFTRASILWGLAEVQGAPGLPPSWKSEEDTPLDEVHLTHLVLRRRIRSLAVLGTQPNALHTPTLDPRLGPQS